MRIGVVGVVSNTWLPTLVEKLRQSHPKVELRIDVNLTRVLMGRLRDGLLDLAIVAGAVNDPGLHQELLGYDDFVWMAGPSLNAPEHVLGPADLKQWPVLTLSEDSHHYPVVKQWFRDAGVLFKSALACNNMTVLAELTRRGLGVSLLPRHCYRNDIAAGRLVVLKTNPAMPRVAFSLAYRIDHVPVLAPIVAEAAKAACDLPLG